MNKKYHHCFAYETRKGLFKKETHFDILNQKMWFFYLKLLFFIVYLQKIAQMYCICCLVLILFGFELKKCSKNSPTNPLFHTTVYWKIEKILVFSKPSLMLLCCQIITNSTASGFPYPNEITCWLKEPNLKTRRGIPFCSYTNSMNYLWEKF